MNRRTMACLVLTGLAACSSSGDNTDPTTAVSVDSTSTTTSPTTTTSTTTTVPPTTTTTTLAPTTTTDPTADLEAVIERDLNLGEQALLAAVADPGNETLRQGLERYYSGTSLSLVLDTLDVLVTDGLVGRPNPDVPSIVRVVSVIERPVDQGNEPTIVELCRLDSAVIYEPLDDGNEIIVNDLITVETSSSRVYLNNETWVLDGGVLLDALGPEERC